MSLLPPLLGWLIVAVVAAAVVASYLAGHRARAAGILVAAASWSAVTAPIGTVDIRLEQPAVVGLAVLLLLREPASIARVLRATIPVVALVAVFLGAQFASSALYAPDPGYSLRIAAWMAFSAGSAWVIATLLAGSPDGGRKIGQWLVVAALVQVAVAMAQVGAELLLESNWGVLRTDSPVGKAFGLSWEPNLLCISLAVAASFAIFAPDDAVPGGRRRAPLVLGFLAVGLGLALSRGGLVALAAGSGAALIVGLWLPRRTGWTLPDASWRTAFRWSVATLSLAVALTLGIRWAGEQGLGMRPGDTAAPSEEGTVGSLVPVPSGAPSSPAPGESPRPGSGPTATPVPGKTYYGISDTISLRLRNMRVAIEDTFVQSPFIGLGTSSFGQRYLEPDCRCPSHIPNMTAATIYESGFVGFGAVALAFAIILARCIAVRRLDLVAALLVLLVGYQFTDALRFGSSWMLAGIAISAILPGHLFNRERSGTPPGSGLR